MLGLGFTANAFDNPTALQTFLPIDQLSASLRHPHPEHTSWYIAGTPGHDLRGPSIGSSFAADRAIGERSVIAILSCRGAAYSLCAPI